MPATLNTLTLAQQLGNLNQVLDIPAPPPLPSPPALQHYLFEQPWPLAGICLAAAVATFFIFQHHANPKKAYLLAGIGLLLAGGFILLASLVHTPREHARDASDRLIAAVATADTAALRNTLTPDARYYGHLAPADGLPVMPLLDLVDATFNSTANYAIESWAIEQFQAHDIKPTQPTDQRRVQVQLKVRVNPKNGQYNVPVRAWFRLDFIQNPTTNTYTCSAIEAVHIQWVN